MPTLGNNLDFAKLEARNMRAHNNGSSPSSPVTGQVYYNTVDNILYWYNGTSWISAAGGGTPADATTSSKGIVQLAGDLAGTAASPQIAAGVITDAEVATANKDGSTATASMRTLGFTSPQAMPGNSRVDQLQPPNLDVNWNSVKITSLGTPSASTDAATKGYVDTTTQGLDAKQSVRLASAANHALLSGALVVDGTTVVTGDRILIKDSSTSPTENGIWIANTAGLWTRATDADTWSELVSAYVFVESGSTNADTGWVCTVDPGGTIGVNTPTWTQFTGAGQITAGTGMTKTGNTLDVIGTTNRISVAADAVDISSAYVGQATITTLGTITTGTWTGTDIAVADGGTGASTAATARTNLVAAGYYSSATHGAGATISITQATHGLRASRGLIVQTQVEATGAVIDADVTVASSGDVTVTFAASQSANTIRTTIIG